MNFTEIGPQPIWNSTFTDKLRHDILLNYDKFARPAQHYNATTVKFGLTIRHIEFNEFRSTLNVNAWLHLVLFIIYIYLTYALIHINFGN